MFILVAILTEAIGLFVLALNGWAINFPGLNYAAVAVLFAIKLIAIVLVAVFTTRALGVGGAVEGAV